MYTGTPQHLHRCTYITRHVTHNIHSCTHTTTRTWLHAHHNTYTSRVHYNTSTGAPEISVTYSSASAAHARDTHSTCGLHLRAEVSTHVYVIYSYAHVRMYPRDSCWTYMQRHSIQYTHNTWITALQIYLRHFLQQLLKLYWCDWYVMQNKTEIQNVYSTFSFLLNLNK